MRFYFQLRNLFITSDPDSAKLLPSTPSSLLSNSRDGLFLTLLNSNCYAVPVMPPPGCWKHEIPGLCASEDAYERCNGVHASQQLLWQYPLSCWKRFWVRRGEPFLKGFPAIIGIPFRYSWEVFFPGVGREPEAKKIPIAQLVHARRNSRAAGLSGEMSRGAEVMIYRLGLGYRCSWEIVVLLRDENHGCELCNTPLQYAQHRSTELPAGEQKNSF